MENGRKMMMISSFLKFTVDVVLHVKSWFFVYLMYMDPGPEISAGHRSMSGDKTLLTGRGHSKVGQLDPR